MPTWAHHAERQFMIEAWNKTDSVLAKLGQFLQRHANSNSSVNYTMLKYSLRGNQQYENMKLVFKHFS